MIHLPGIIDYIGMNFIKTIDHDWCIILYVLPVLFKETERSRSSLEHDLVLRYFLLLLGILCYWFIFAFFLFVFNLFGKCTYNFLFRSTAVLLDLYVSACWTYVPDGVWWMIKYVQLWRVFNIKNINCLICQIW